MHKKVRDVMTTEVVAVTADAPFRVIAEVLATRGVSAVPVIDGATHVLGVISEADLLHKEELREQYYKEDYRPPPPPPGHPGRRDATEKARGHTAAELMSAPAVTIEDCGSVVNAARLMHEKGVKRLPVVGDDGRLRGIVSRHDLLKVFLRSDHDIADEVREDIIDGLLWADTSGVCLRVTGGVVTLSGWIEHRSDARILLRMTERINGVVDVIDRLEWAENDIPG
ncbi:CBS domain-containing protein [Sphaerimonospora mesophila]|uniref:CBS domain-containing protein n=1 Tax=Sphaerimonospora mesophila TaxID=37483 RepID=UPI0007C87B11